MRETKETGKQEVSKQTKLVLVHQVGRVGSKSVEESVRKSNKTAQVVHIHYLHPENHKKYMEIANGKNAIKKTADAFAYHPGKAHRIVEFLKCNQKNLEHLTVISGYRDPLDHAISNFFQNLSDLVPQCELIPETHETDLKFAQKTFFNLVNKLIKNKRSQRFHTLLGMFAVRGPMSWFDTEMNVYGIDIYKHKPDPDGIITIRGKQVLHIVYKFETLDQQLAKITSMVPGSNNFVEVKTNRARDKEHNDLYTEFRKRFLPTEEMMEYYYNNKYFKHFYANENPHFQFTEK
ncbi:MAG: hypothetical protein GY931_14345 [Maribacter sp.]|nr:hypothetical protein [Maribacter sp.]